MVCLEECSTVCIIIEKGLPLQKVSLVVRPSYTVADLFRQVGTQFEYDSFELLLKSTTEGLNNDVLLNNMKDKTLTEVGLKFDKNYRNTIIINQLNTNNIENMSQKEMITEISPSNDPLSDDEMVLGASASPTETDITNISTVPALPMFESGDNSSYKSSIKLYSSPRPAVGYVGLVNQAMTCYLNSLLQALFMTPEFRNALYNWEYDGIDELKSIPYQLQKLFLNLQTSAKLAVETTDLTKSFGWDSTEAWQQHDIQELCRVMFDALEQKFKNTKQSDLINRLYEGKMIDYVKCLDCGTEKSREDTLLDIPLPVRPFGSSAAYASVEEALCAFVQPETLNENNQYFCEKCNKKCDAHKGLKFTKFPYILTLHLKRFDFDYQTLHRIKLNDKVTFPQTLNLNGLVNDPDSSGLIPHTTVNGEHAPSEPESVESAVKCDDCSTTDSGSALEEDNTTFITGAGPNNYQDLADDDEGIDMTTSTDNKCGISNETGPYIYELFAIMIHSGSASGGHYYAYIKDFETSEWYCFNDQTVTTITQEDIQKSFGGGSFRAYYSGAYSSSTNAYMLMYRQVDRHRNCMSMKMDEFPEHIKKLLQRLKDKDENDKKMKEYEQGMQKLKIFFNHPKQKRLIDCKIYMSSDATFEDTLHNAYNRLILDNIAPIERCRLVAYDSKTGNCEMSFEGRDKEEIVDIMSTSTSMGTTMGSEFLLEIREENGSFEVYLPGGLMTRVYVVDLHTSDIDGPIPIRGMGTGTIGEFRKLVASKLNLNYESIILSTLNFKSEARILDTDDVTMIREQIYALSKIFVTTFKKGEDVASKLKRIVERYDHIITLYFVLPNTDKETLEKMSIPSYDPTPPIIENNIIVKGRSTPTQIIPPPPAFNESKDVVDAMMINKPTNTIVNVGHIISDCLRTSPQPPIETECNSEDSSLSDGDRTLVESAPDELSHISSTSLSPACSDPHLSSPDDSTRKLNEFDEEMDTIKSGRTTMQYFKATQYDELTNNLDGTTQKMLKVLVDRNMLIGTLKNELKPIIKVSTEYFKIFRISAAQTETECTRMTEGLSCFKDGERLIIELGRVLRKGEYKCKIYYLKLSEVSDDTDKIPFLCEWIFRSGANVGQTKQEIISHMASIDSKYDIALDRCRLRKKNCKNPGKIYLDDQKFDDDIPLTNSSEIILQELDGNSQIVDDPEDIVLFVRRWNPPEMILGPYQEVTVKSKTEFKQLLSDLSGIPVERIEYTKLNGSFFRYTISVVNIHTVLSWTSHPITLDDWPLNGPQDGHIYYYRDSSDILKELTSDERRELNGRENSRIERLGSTSIYSPRKERALKIYLDASPKKRDE